MHVSAQRLRVKRAPITFSDGKKKDQAEHTGDDGAENGGEPHREQRVRETAGSEVCAGNADAEAGDHVVQKGKRGFFARAEIAAEAEMNAAKEAVQHITSQIGTAGGDGGSIRCEKSDKRLRSELREQGIPVKEV